MKKRVWMVISLILAYIPLLIPLEGGHGLEAQEKWVARYNGPANSYDGANAIALDGSGNVYVTGWSGNDYATIKYNTNGKQLWVKTYDGPAKGGDEATAIAVDRSGNVYVTGSSGGLGGGWNTDYVTIKYNTNGKQLWVKRYNGVANGRNCANAIALDSSGNVYVTGTKKSADDDNATDFICDYATIKYNANGKQLWVKTYNGPADSSDEASAIALDSSGNVYVTGTSYGDADDYATIKYNTNGKQLWAKKYPEPGNSQYGASGASAIAVDRSGNVYVTGSSYGLGGAVASDYATIKYDTNGKKLWVKTYDGPANGENTDDQASAIAVDRSGNVYVTGISAGLGTILDDDYATIKYNTSGKQLWVKRYNGPANRFSHDEAKAIAVDGSGNVYVTGESEGLGTNGDMATIKY